jgi:hypothetical protein
MAPPSQPTAALKAGEARKDKDSDVKRNTPQYPDGWDRCHARGPQEAFLSTGGTCRVDAKKNQPLQLPLLWQSSALGGINTRNNSSNTDISSINISRNASVIIAVYSYSRAR